ncbi:MAG TPA: hypothetical protein VGD15_02355 [Kribbella sp.]|jgi:hypothetical protein
MRVQSKIAAVAGIALMTAGISTTAQATTTGVLGCDNAAWKPYKTGTGRGFVTGEVQRSGDSCGNASVVVTVYRENGFFDQLVASREQTFAYGRLAATGTCLGTGDFYTQIRINGVTVAQSDAVHIACY